MKTGKDRVQVDTVQVPDNIGDARVCPGDLIRADSDGVVVLPHDLEQRTLDTAEAIQAAEEKIRAAVRAGRSLRAARAEIGYHSLQTKA